MQAPLSRHVLQRLLLFAESSSFTGAAATRNGPPRYLPTSSPLSTFSTAHRPRPYRARLPARGRAKIWPRKSNPWLRDPDLAPGYKAMLDLNTSKKLESRLPPAEGLAKAWNTFFEAQEKKAGPVLEVHAMHAANTLRHLQTVGGDQAAFGLTVRDLRVALRALVVEPENHVRAHNELARLVYKDLAQRVPDTEPLRARDLLRLVAVLCHTGDALEARLMVQEHEERHPSVYFRTMWYQVISGLVAEGKDQEAEATLARISERDSGLYSKLLDDITKAYAKRDDIANTKKWFAVPRNEGTLASWRTYRDVLRLCIRKEELEWGNRLCQTIIEKNPNKKTWDVVFQWAAAIGKGPDEVDRMIGVMVRRDDELEREGEQERERVGGREEGREGEQEEELVEEREENRGSDREGQMESKLRRWPDVYTFNGLLELANLRNDSYQSERFLALAKKWGFAPNGRTRILQIDYRLKAGDVTGAKLAYDDLRDEEYHGTADDVRVLNQLMRAFCESKFVKHEDIMTLEHDARLRQDRLEPDTLAALCIFHLRREELSDVIVLLKEHVFHYSLGQRARLAENFIRFIRDRDVPTQVAWDAYTMIEAVIDEISVGQRVDLMREFFARGRSDMAAHTFGHIRQNEQRSQRPTGDTYVACFEGIAEAGDAEALQMVHNMLKLDFTIEPDTRLLNALMLVYHACESPQRSLSYWEDIAGSLEGPTYNSFLIALRVCESSPGEREYEIATSIWERIEELKIKVTNELAAAFIGVMAAHDHLKEASTFIKKLEKEKGITPDVLMIGTMHNLARSPGRREAVLEWAEMEYPAVLEQLHKLGTRLDGEDQGEGRVGVTVFDIDRTLHA